MERKQPQPPVAPRLIIHGGAGNIRQSTMPCEKRTAYRAALHRIITQASAYMLAPAKSGRGRTALETATHAVTLLEDDPLFNSGHGAVFTRDGINELEASVMVSRGYAKRAAGVMGLRRVRSPVLLARAVLEHGDADLNAAASAAAAAPPDAPSAQGHTQIHGETAEALARRYGLEMVEPGYFFTQTRWDEHVRGLERESEGGGVAGWSRDEFLPQGTVGAVALDAEGVVCCATSTGGLTNKLTGRIGDTPVPGAGFWAEEWLEDGDPSAPGAQVAENGVWGRIGRLVAAAGTAVTLSDSLRGFMADCWPTPFVYTPMHSQPGLVARRSLAVSGTGNGDSFLRVAAVRTVGAIARFAGASGAAALSKVVGPSGELQKSAGDRWGRTGEGEGGMIGIECVVVRDAHGSLVGTRTELLQDFNSGGMFRAWVDEDGEPQVRIFRDE